MSSKLWILLTTLLLLSISCKQQEKAQKKPSSNISPPEETPPADTSKKDNDEIEKDDCKSDSSGLRLLASIPTYDDDISSILKDKCESCHSGSDQYALDTFKKAKSLRNEINSQIESGDMPPKNKSPLTSAEKKAIKNWANAGAPETSDDVGDGEAGKSEENGCDEKSDASNDDDNDDTESSASEDDWDELLKKKEVEKCRDKGNIYDRLKETCHKAKIAVYKCDKAGIEAEFKRVGVDVTTHVTEFLTSGYDIDQCGQFNNEPIVLFYKKETIKDEIKLLIKKLCKMGSDACDN